MLVKAPPHNRNVEGNTWICRGVLHPSLIQGIHAAIPLGRDLKVPLMQLPPRCLRHSNNMTTSTALWKTVSKNCSAYFTSVAESSWSPPPGPLDFTAVQWAAPHNAPRLCFSQSLPFTDRTAKNAEVLVPLGGMYPGPSSHFLPSGRSIWDTFTRFLGGYPARWNLLCYPQRKPTQGRTDLTSCPLGSRSLTVQLKPPDVTLQVIPHTVFQGMPLELWFTFDQVIDGLGIPLALHGKVTGMPSIVLSICCPCWMVGRTGDRRKGDIWVPLLPFSIIYLKLNIFNIFLMFMKKQFNITLVGECMAKTQ